MLHLAAYQREKISNVPNFQFVVSKKLKITVFILVDNKDNLFKFSIYYISLINSAMKVLILPICHPMIHWSNRWLLY